MHHYDDQYLQMDFYHIYQNHVFNSSQVQRKHDTADVRPHNRPCPPAGKDKRTWTATSSSSTSGPQTGVVFVGSNVLHLQDVISQK